MRIADFSRRDWPVIVLDGKKERVLLKDKTKSLKLISLEF